MNWGLFSKKETVTDPETVKVYRRMVGEIQKVGGLSFLVSINEGGWAAECEEFPGIITGGTSTNPNDEEVMNSIIESVKTAFHVPIQVECEKKDLRLKINTKRLVSVSV